MHWRVEFIPSLRSVHIHPLRDQVSHELREDCVCGPTAESVQRVDGSDGWLYAHHALDGRERYERP